MAQVPPARPDPAPPPAAAPAPVQDESGSGGASVGWGSLLSAGAALALGIGWTLERRHRRLLETEKDSVMWADHQPAGPSIVTTAGGLDDILPDSPNPFEAARAIYVTGITESSSRREATLIDLHQLDGKLQRRRKRGDVHAAVLLLQQHLMDFRYSSPWVFLELRDLYRQLERQKEWESAKLAFRHRFGQNAPAWETDSTAADHLADDSHLCEGLVRDWPYREARLFVMDWLLGSPRMRKDCSGPPLLALGAYRDFLMIDEVLDEVLDNRTVPADSLL